MLRGNWKLCVWVCNKLATGIKRMACFGKNVFTSDAKGSMCISHGHNPEYPSVKTEMQNLCKRTTVGEACLINKVLWKGNQWGNPVSLPACPPILVCCSRMANDAAKPLQSIRKSSLSLASISGQIALLTERNSESWSIFLITCCALSNTMASSSLF